MKSGSLDAVFLSQALHHAARPAAAIAEAARVLKRGGMMLVLDLVRHDQEWVREQWADQWLGFEEREVLAWMDENGLRPVAREQLAGVQADLRVLLVVGVKKTSHDER